jgi:hypothetical protein
MEINGERRRPGQAEQPQPFRVGGFGGLHWPARVLGIVIGSLGNGFFSEMRFIWDLGEVEVSLVSSSCSLGGGGGMLSTTSR